MDTNVLSLHGRADFALKSQYASCGLRGKCRVNAMILRVRSSVCPALDALFRGLEL
jgi:hypothetical protein